MVLLVIELMNFMETDGHGDLGSCVRTGHPEGSAKLSRALLHDGDTEVTEAEACVRGLKSAAIVANDKTKEVAFVPDLNIDRRGFRMAKRVGHGFLPDADQVMNRARRDWNFISL